jgi:bifunctional pyridoxal-dependent enzyme with beta-cystathionase and maltose regulon repressor activities
MNITLDPENLMVRIPQEERVAAWKGHKFTKQGAGFRTIDAAEQRHRNKLQREYDRVQAQKRADRLKALREYY